MPDQFCHVTLVLIGAKSSEPRLFGTCDISVCKQGISRSSRSIDYGLTSQMTCSSSARTVKMDSDSDVDFDISAALLAPAKSKKGAKSTAPRASTSAAAKTGATAAPSSDLADSDSDDDEDALFASLPSLNRSKNLAESTELIKQRKDLKQTRGLVGGGSFQALGLPPALFKALLQRGFTQPTPIQRLALPSILGSTETIVAGKKMIVARDHLCMARTGSGKTLCYLLPMLAQFMTHSTTFGARGLILVPTRELALQVLKVGKDLARGLRGEGEVLRWAMIVGGEAMEEQFDLLASNPDV